MRARPVGYSAPLVLSAALVLGHAVAHLVLPRWWWQGPHVAGNLAVTALVTASNGRAPAGNGRPVRQVLVTATATIALGAATALAMRRPGLHRAYAEERVGAMPLRRRWLHLLVMIPLGSVLTEEVVFRGVLHRRWEEATGTWWGGVLGSAAVFGLWHVGPSLAALRRMPSMGRGDMAALVSRTVGATALAGVGFGALRVLSGGLAAPVGGHLAINVIGSVTAAGHGRR